MKIPPSRPVWACADVSARGRRWVEPPAPTRTDFQRDRDRIVHCTAFRRLVYKTQVFLNHEGDLFRTRMTHSLEVAQLGRSVARTLGLNEDLVEAIALAHDLGHTPFGHAGQEALNDCMSQHGGFEHNLQSLRVVDILEERYPAFDGLNLCFETREGILKHCSRRNAALLESESGCEGHEGGGVGQRFLSNKRPSLEAQLCDLADEIAYNTHDIDDGVRSGLISLEQVGEVGLFNLHMKAAMQEHPRLTGRRLLYESNRRMLSALVYDAIATSRQNIEQGCLSGIEDVRSAPTLMCFGADTQTQLQALKMFLREHLYRHPRVMETTGHAQRVVRALFETYVREPTLMPDAFAKRPNTARAASDYIAGMTDRFAAREHARLTGEQLFVVDR